jgi:predicted Zn-dependent protease
MFIWIFLLALNLSCFAQTPPAAPSPAPPSQATELEAKLAAKPEHMKTRLQLATIYAQEDKPDKVIALLNPYTDQMTSNGFLMLAGSYAKKKDFTNEVRVLNILAAKEDENFRWQMLLAQAYLKQAGETTNPERNAELLTLGIQRLRSTLSLQKTYKPAFDLLLKTLLQQQANNEARELLIEGITRFGRRPELYRELCQLEAMDGFLVQAVTYCKESIKISPDYPEHYVYLVQAYNDQKEDRLAEKEIVKAAKKFPQSEVVQWAAGELFRRRKNYPVAARYFQAAVKAKEDSGRAQFGLAQSLYESGAEDKALEHFVRACKLDVSSLETFLTAGGRLKQKGNTELGSKYTSAANNCR